MSIIKKNNEMRPYYSSLLDEFLNTGMLPAQCSCGENCGIPALNAREDEKTLMLEIRVPGMKKDDIKLDYKDGFLTIMGESKDEKEEENVKYLRREFSAYSFRRTIELPAEKYDVTDSSAKYDNGILTIHIPKNKEITKYQKTIAIE